MKMTKLASFILFLTVAVFLTNGFAGDLPAGAIVRIDVSEGPCKRYRILSISESARGSSSEQYPYP